MPLVRGPLQPRPPRVPPIPSEWAKLQHLRQQAHRDAIDPYIVQFATKLARPFRADDHLGIVRSVFRWVRDGIRYQSDPDKVQDYADATAILARGWGNCVCKTKLVVALLRALGYDADFVPVWGQDGSMPHVYMRVRFPGSAKVAGSVDGWIYGEMTIRGAELTQDPHAIAPNPETGKLPLSGGPLD